MGEQVLFQGEFNLENALRDFYNFANAIETRLKRMSSTFTGNTQGKGFNLFGTTAKDVEDAEKRITTAQKRVGDGFINMAIRSYALHQIGNFLDRTVTQPIQRLAHEIFQTTLRFDSLTELLEVRGNKSMLEIGRSIDLIGKTAKLRNLDLETSVGLYSKLFEATRGALDDQLFEKISKGLSNVLTTIESGEKRAFFGQIQDILGGGNVANLERTLSLAPALKSVFDELKAATPTLSDTEAIIEAFGRLGDLPAINDLATKVKNIRVEFELLAYKIGQIYHDEIEGIVDFITDKVLPAVDDFIDRFSKAPAFLQNMVAGLLAITAALAPILSTLGTLVLLFPNSALAVNFFGTIGNILKTLPALLNPITAVVAVLVAILTKAFVENQGGFGDAVRTLADTVLPALADVLKTVYDTVKAIVDIAVNFYNLIDAIIPLTATIGAIGSGLAYILTYLSQALSILKVIPATLQLVADILNGDIQTGFDKFYLQWLKIGEPINKVIASITGISDFSHQKEIDELEKSVGELSKTAKDGTDEQNRAQSELLAKYKAVQVSVKAITDAIKEQNRAIDQQILKNRQANIERQGQLSRYLADQRTSSFTQTVSDSDLTTESGRQKAQAAFETSLTSEGLAIQDERTRRIQKNIRDFLVKQREQVVAALQKEVKENGDKLDEETKKIYQQYAILLEKAIYQSGNITQEGADSYIYGLLQKELTRSKLAQPQLKALAEYIANEKVLFGQIYEGQIKDTTEIIENQKKAEEKRKEFYENLRKAAEEEEKQRKSAPVQNQISQLDADIDRIQDVRSRYIELQDEIIDLDKFVGQIITYDEQLIKKVEERAEKEKQLAFIQYESGLKYDLAIKQINQQAKETIEKVKDSSRLDRDKIFQDIIKSEIQQAEQLKGLVQKFQDSVSNYADISILTGNFNQKAVDKINANYDLIFQLMTEQNLKKMQRFTEVAAPILAGVPANIAEPLRKAFTSLAKTAQTELSNPEVRKNLIEQSTDIVKLLTTYLNTGTDLAPQAKAQLQLFIDQYVKFVQSIIEGQNTLTQKIDADSLKLQIKEADLERQQTIVDLTQDELEITQQILELRRQRGFIPDIKNLKGFGQAVLDIFTNGRQAQYELEKAILEQQIRAAQIETELAITRLQIEEKILLLKLKEAGASEAEIQKVKEEFEREIDLLKEKGELQRILLDEQMKQLREFSGGITEVFGQIFSKIFQKITGGGDKPHVGVLDELGNEHEIEEDENIDEPVISDDATDATGQNVDKTIGWLDKLKGGLGTTKDAIFALGDAISQMNELSIKSILRTLKEELKALGAKFAIKAIEYAALAISAAVFGDYHTAGKAAAAAAAWGAASVAAYAAAGLIGTIDGNGAQNTQSSASRNAGTTNANEPTRDKQLLKQQALSIWIQLDIRTDDGIIIKKNIKALNQNTELTNLTLNSQEGWAFSPTV